MRRVSRREALLASGGLLGALLLDGCGGARPAAPSGSTLVTRWGDPAGDGQLVVTGGEVMVHRTDLARSAVLGRPVATLGHLTDAHVMDASSPARVPFLARLGPPFQSTFRPQEALTAHVLYGAVTAMRAFAPDVVVQGGDLTDNVQANELAAALALLAGGRVVPGSGPHGYDGVQIASDPDPFYYRPDLDAPRHPGLLTAASRPFSAAPGLGRIPWLPVFGDHDLLVAGEIVPDPVTAGLAVGDRALWELPTGISLPSQTIGQVAGSPDGPAFDPGIVGTFVREALAGPTVSVPADAGRRELTATEVIARLRAASARGGVVRGTPEELDYVVDVGSAVRLVVLDLASRSGGSGGRVVAGQSALLAGALRTSRWVVFISHQPLRQSAGGAALQSLLDDSDRVILTLAGHTHRNRVAPRSTPGGGYWEIETSSLIDWPQQSRALRIRETPDGVAIETWMLDHAAPGGSGRIGRISRELSYLDAQGGRPGGFAGSSGDRNAVLYLRR